MAPTAPRRVSAQQTRVSAPRRRASPWSACRDKRTAGPGVQRGRGRPPHLWVISHATRPYWHFSSFSVPLRTLRSQYVHDSIRQGDSAIVGITGWLRCLLQIRL
jgi:hypothetical protein